MSIANLGADPVADSEGTLLDMWPSRDAKAILCQDRGCETQGR